MIHAHCPGPSLLHLLPGPCTPTPTPDSRPCLCRLPSLARCLAACLQEILDVEQVMEENKGLELTAENVDTVLDEIRWVRALGCVWGWGCKAGWVTGGGGLVLCSFCVSSCCHVSLCLPLQLTHPPPCLPPHLAVLRASSMAEWARPSQARPAASTLARRLPFLPQCLPHTAARSTQRFRYFGCSSLRHLHSIASAILKSLQAGTEGPAVERGSRGVLEQRQ